MYETGDIMKQNLKTILTTLTMLLALPCVSLAQESAQVQKPEEQARSVMSHNFGIGAAHFTSPIGSFERSNMELSLNTRWNSDIGHGLSIHGSLNSLTGMGITLFGPFPTQSNTYQFDIRYSYRLSTNKRIQGISASFAIESGLVYQHTKNEECVAYRSGFFSGSCEGGYRTVAAYNNFGGVVAVAPKVHFGGFDLGGEFGLKVFVGDAPTAQFFGVLTLGASYNL